MTDRPGPGAWLGSGAWHFFHLHRRLLPLSVSLLYSILPSSFYVPCLHALLLHCLEWWDWTWTFGLPQPGQKSQLRLGWRPWQLGMFGVALSAQKLGREAHLFVSLSHSAVLHAMPCQTSFFCFCSAGISSPLSLVSILVHPWRRDRAPCSFSPPHQLCLPHHILWVNTPL